MAVSYSVKSTDETKLWVERTGTRRCTGRSSRGAQVLVGPVQEQGVFTPGELMKVALAACTSLSADAVLGRRLGEDFLATVHVSGPPDREREVYPEIVEHLVVDLSGLSEQERVRVDTAVRRAVAATCTVGRTLQQGTDIRLEVSGSSA